MVLATSRSFWHADSCRVVEVPPHLLGGQENVLALLPASGLAASGGHAHSSSKAEGGGGWWQRPHAHTLLESPDAVVIWWCLGGGPGGGSRGWWVQVVEFCFTNMSFTVLKSPWRNAVSSDAVDLLHNNACPTSTFDYSVRDAVAGT